MTTTPDASTRRVDALTRLVGIVVLAFGLAMIYYTYANTSVPGQAPTLIPVFYMVGALLSVAGGIATFAKFK